MTASTPNPRKVKSGERCAVAVGTHYGPYWRDLNSSDQWVVCDRHRRQYAERDDLGPFDWVPAPPAASSTPDEPGEQRTQISEAFAAKALKMGVPLRDPFRAWGDSVPGTTDVTPFPAPGSRSPAPHPLQVAAAGGRLPTPSGSPEADERPAEPSSHGGQSLDVPSIFLRLERMERLTPLEVAVLRDALDAPPAPVSPEDGAAWTTEDERWVAEQALLDFAQEDEERAADQEASDDPAGAAECRRQGDIARSLIARLRRPVPVGGDEAMPCVNCGASNGSCAGKISRGEGGCCGSECDHRRASDHPRFQSHPAVPVGGEQPDPRPAELLPAESICLTTGLAQVLRGDDVLPATAMMCVLALARIAGRHDWTAEDAAAAAVRGEQET